MSKKITGIEIINPGSNPDVDSDFNTTYRDKTLEYVTDLYGKDNVSNIVTFGTLAAKGAFKAMCTIYNIPFSRANKIANLIPSPVEGKECTLDDIFDKTSDRYSEGADFRSATAGEEWKDIINGARNIEGRNRSTGVHPCFVAGTLVGTSDGLKKIEEIHEGDRVLTHLNRYREVIGTMRNRSDDIYHLTADNSLPLDVTGNHPFWVREVIKSPSESSGRILSDPRWMQVSELVPGRTVIGVPVNDSVIIPQGELPFDNPDFWWTVGRFAADGRYDNFSSDTGSHDDGQPRFCQQKRVVFSVGYNDTTYRELLTRISTNFGFSVRENITVREVSISHDENLFAFLENFGNCDDNRTIPTEILDLPAALLEEFLNGYLSVRGHRSDDGEVTFTAPNTVVLTGMISVVNKVHRTQCVISHNVVRTSSTECCRAESHEPAATFTAFSEDSGTFRQDGCLWVAVRSVEKTNRKAVTYNLSVDEDNSYTVSSLAVHNCGILISAKPLDTIIPMQVRQTDGRVITQWTYQECESLGLIKMDFLGLDTVDLIQHTVEYIKRNGKNPPNMLDIVHGDMDDKKVYELFQKGDTTGIFQFGSEMVRNLLLSMRPTEFNDLSACTAVARPGPMGMKSHVKYADRKNGREKIDFIHPEFVGSPLEEILRPTYGLCVPKDTPILDSSRGERVPIQDLVEGVSTTPSLNGDTGAVEDRTVTHVMYTGWKKILKISTDSNRTLRVSETHPVLTGRGYVPAGEITVEDRIRTVPGLSEDDDPFRKTSHTSETCLNVVSVVEDGYEECYDIEVDGNHNFLVNGFVVHNCLYQEQVMSISNKIAGFTLAEGDKLRKAMGKKKIDVMLAMQEKFFKGAEKNGYSKEAVTVLWNTIKEFSKYGFNKSHSVAYAINAYQAAFLKVHFPIEFMASLIAQNIDDRKKTVVYLREAKRMRVKVGTVDINLSDVKVAPDYSKKSGYEVLFGISGVKEVSENVAADIVRERSENGDFTSVKDVIDRCTARGITNRRVFENLALAGAFDLMESNRNAVLTSVKDMMGDARKKNSMGSSLFDMFDVEEGDTVNQDVEDFTFTERLKNEADMLGLYLSAHPLDRIQRGVGGTTTINKLIQSPKKTSATIIASLVDFKKKQKRTGKSITVELDDGTGYMNARLTQDVIAEMDKYEAQEQVRRLYENGSNEVPSDILSRATDRAHISTAPLDKNSIYVMHVQFTPARDDLQYNVSINSIRLMKFSKDGSLPLRIRFKHNDENAEKMEELFRKIPRTLGRKSPGSHDIIVSSYTDKDLRKPCEKDVECAAAVEEMRSDRRNGIDRRDKDSGESDLGGRRKKGSASKNKTKKKVRSWPPKENPDVYVPNRPIDDISQCMELLEYQDTGFSTTMDDRVSGFLEKWLGYESYDLGIFDKADD